MSNIQSQPEIEIRQATERDIEDVRQLLSNRDQRSWSTDDMRWLFYGLDPSHCVAWLALDEDKPVGFTSMFLRTLYWRGETHRAAYWTNLFIDPAYSQFMLYPRLPRTMFNWVTQSDVEFLYAAVRRTRVAKAHRAIGFARCGDFTVQFRPIRPARLLAKHKSLGNWSNVITRPVDWTFGCFQALKAPRTRAAVSIGSDDDRVVSVAKILNDDSVPLFAQRWSAEILEHRYRRTAEGDDYHILVADGRAPLEATVVYRIAKEWSGLNICVILDAAATESGTNALRVLFNEVFQRSRANDCDLVIALGGVSDRVGEIMKRSGFRASPEFYELMIWPTSFLREHPWCSDVENWRFCFGDHDAF